MRTRCQSAVITRGKEGPFCCFQIAVGKPKLNVSSWRGVAVGVVKSGVAVAILSVRLVAFGGRFDWWVHFAFLRVLICLFRLPPCCDTMILASSFTILFPLYRRSSIFSWSPFICTEVINNRVQDISPIKCKHIMRNWWTRKQLTHSGCSSFSWASDVGKWAVPINEAHGCIITHCWEKYVIVASII